MAVQITYRWTGRLSMRVVKNGDVHVSAPYGTSKRVIEAFIGQHREWLEKAREKAAQSQEKRAAFYARLPLTTNAQRVEVVSRLSAIVEPMIARHSQEMGVAPSSISYRRMISRWGVCKIKEKSICFSLYLLLLPEWCIEHIVVHELCHLIEPSHNARFHALMDKYYPRWHEARKETLRLLRG